MKLPKLLKKLEAHFIGSSDIGEIRRLPDGSFQAMVKQEVVLFNPNGWDEKSLAQLKKMSEDPWLKNFCEANNIDYEAHME